MKKTDRPVLRGWVFEHTPGHLEIRVYCPYCDKFHYHGWYKGCSGGHLVAHCVLDTPFRKTGYYVYEWRIKDLKEMKKQGA